MTTLSNDRIKGSNKDNQPFQVVCLVLKVLWLSCLSTYEIFKAIYLLFVPDVEKSVKGEIILITGAGHGIGKELSLQFASLGATVVCWDINQENNERTVQEIIATGAPKAYAYQCDVTNRQTILDLARTVQSEVGNVTMLVNNAGIMPCKSFQKYTETEIRRTFDINVFAHFWMLEAFLPSMLERNHGHVVALSSMAGMVGLRNLVPYCASKFAVRGLMEALREELRETFANTNVKFTTIYPHMVDTGLCKKPHSRFPALFSPVSTKLAVEKIISATRRNLKECSVHAYLIYLNTVTRLYPESIAILLKDFLDTYVDADQ